MTVSRETLGFNRNLERQIEQKLSGRRQRVFHGGTLCSHCLHQPPRAPDQKYCKTCHAAANRAYNGRKRAELARLRALEKELSKGKDNGQVEEESGAAEN